MLTNFFAQRTPTHSVSIHEMKGAWNQFNRIVLIGLYDSYMRAQALRRNLSSEALKGFRVESSSNTAVSWMHCGQVKGWHTKTCTSDCGWLCTFPTCQPLSHFNYCQLAASDTQIQHSWWTYLVTIYVCQ